MLFFCSNLEVSFNVFVYGLCGKSVMILHEVKDMNYEVISD